MPKLDISLYEEYFPSYYSSDLHKYFAWPDPNLFGEIDRLQDNFQLNVFKSIIPYIKLEDALTKGHEFVVDTKK